MVGLKNGIDMYCLVLQEQEIEFLCGCECEIIDDRHNWLLSFVESERDNMYHCRCIKTENVWVCTILLLLVNNVMWTFLSYFMFLQNLFVLILCTISMSLSLLISTNKSLKTYNKKKFVLNKCIRNVSITWKLDR